MEAKTLSVFLSLALTLFSTSLAAEKNDSLDPFNLYSTDDFFNLEGVSFNGSSWVGTGAGLNASCTEEELAQFPMRMRAWLFNIMQQLSSYPESEGGLKESERELLYQAQEMEDSNYIIPVHWKFLTLDTDQSGDIKGEEMTSFISMLNPIEGCIDQFLENVCDSDKDKRIEKTEWNVCLKLSPEEGDLSVEL